MSFYRWNPYSSQDGAHHRVSVPAPPTPHSTPSSGRSVHMLPQAASRPLDSRDEGMTATPADTPVPPLPHREAPCPTSRPRLVGALLKPPAASTPMATKVPKAKQRLPTFPRGPLMAMGRGCLLCNAPCSNKWKAFCCEDHRAKYFATTHCRQCCCVDGTWGMPSFSDQVCRYVCGVFSKFRLPERVTPQNIELYSRETSFTVAKLSLQGQERLRQLKRVIPPEFNCLGCRVVPSAPRSPFCSEDRRTRKSLSLHLHCFRTPSSATCSEERAYCLTYSLHKLNQLAEFRERLRRDMELDGKRKRLEPEPTDRLQKKDFSPKCTKLLSGPNPLPPITRAALLAASLSTPPPAAGPGLNPQSHCFEFNDSLPIVNDSCESSGCRCGTKIAFFHPAAPSPTDRGGSTHRKVEGKRCGYGRTCEMLLFTEADLAAHQVRCHGSSCIEGGNK